MNLLVRSVSVDTSTVPAGTLGALVDVDLAVGAVEAVVAVAPEPVGDGGAVTIVAWISGTMIYVGTMAT